MCASLAHILRDDETETELTITDLVAPSLPKNTCHPPVVFFFIPRIRMPSTTNIHPSPVPAPLLFTLLLNHSKYENPSGGGKGARERCGSTVGKLRGTGGASGRFVEGVGDDCDRVS